jgi:hypothetical protein
MSQWCASHSHPGAIRFSTPSSTSVGACREATWCGRPGGRCGIHRHRALAERDVGSFAADARRGTPDHVAAQMAEVMDAVCGDGFLIMDPDFTRRYITEIADGLTPALQKLGVVRKKYEHAMLRDNLRAF